ncbi:VanZ family protein [Actinoplanes sp. NPDC051494]|uniref:VanZ family protein n=1 Tax=Actinoplanes sp. NPDC051494 TaxID=3363907 RepID=UPI00379D2F63
MTHLGLFTFIRHPVPLTVLALTVALAWPLSRPLARRPGRARPVAALLVVAIGTVVALTLTPNFGFLPTEVLPPHFLTQLDDPASVWATLTQPPADAEQIANIALYVPVGLLAGLLWKNAVRATLLGFALTAFIETCQYDIPGRAGSLTDIRNNTIGALAGAVLAAVVTRPRGRLRAGPGGEPRSAGTSRRAP